MIENCVNVVAWITELMLFIFCIHGVFREKFRFTSAVGILTVVDVMVFFMIYEGILPEIFTAITHVIIFLYCQIKFKKKVPHTIAYYVVSTLIGGAIEIITTIITVLLIKNIEWDGLQALIMNSISLLQAILVYHLLLRRKRRDSAVFNTKRVIVIIAICCFSVLFMMFDYRFRGEMDQTFYLMFIVLVVAICVYWSKTQKAQFELEKKRLEFEMQEIYGEAYKELIYEVRRRQHDFTNQLGAIYSIHLTATSLEELVEKQQGYGDVLKKQGRYDKILTGCNNPILAGYLYYKCVNMAESNILVEYKIHVDAAESNLSLHEVIEILGILLTNAAENDNLAACEQKMIDLLVEENSKNLVIEVGNSSQYMSSQDVERFFEKGYSTKGENRGIGLTRVKQLSEKSDADIIVENYLKAGVNWIRFKIIIPKRNG